jgi:hypothetical protein
MKKWPYKRVAYLEVDNVLVYYYLGAYYGLGTAYRQATHRHVHVQIAVLGSFLHYS